MTAPIQTPNQAVTNPVIEVNQDAPNFTLQDQNEQTHQLSDYQGKWVVLFFYPKDNTPGCTKEACSFRDNLDEWAQHNAVVFGLSPQNTASKKRFADKHGLNYPILADVDLQASQAFGVWQQKKLYGKSYMGIARTTYIINPEGKVAKRYDKVKTATHAQDVLADLLELQN